MSALPGVVEKIEFSQRGDDTRFELAYRYEVAGRSYLGERLSYTTSAHEQSVFAEAHRPGSPVTVYHDPADPADAVLIREKAALEWPVQGGLLLLVSIPFLWALHGGGGATNRVLVRKYGVGS